MKIFLAGRSPQGPLTHDDWRYQATAGRVVSRYRLDSAEECWPEVKCIYGRHELIGPFFLDDGNYNSIDADHNAVCLSTAVLQSHLLFAWLDEPDPDIFWLMGMAQASNVKVAVGTSMQLSSDHVFYRAADYKFHTTIPAEALLRSVSSAERDVFFNQTWRRMPSRYDGVCVICSKTFEEGEDILYRKTAEQVQSGGVTGFHQRTSETAHLQCFMYGAPTGAIPRDLQVVGLELLQRRVGELEKEKARLVETIKDLA